MHIHTCRLHRLHTGCPLQGLGHVVGYCGDGHNDVPALQAADAGLSMGGAEAGISVVAAPVACLSGSVTGVPPQSSMYTTALALHVIQPAEVNNSSTATSCKRPCVGCEMVETILCSSSLLQFKCMAYLASM